MDNLGAQLGELFHAVFSTGNPLGFLNPDVWRDTLSKPDVFVAALVFLNLIVFVETGLLVGFLLPGDSLLVIVGLVAHQSGWNVPLLIGTLACSAIIGDSVGYWIGSRTGPAIFRREDGRIFKQRYLQAAQDFYQRHGGKTIIYARFVPIVRTFAPVVAGAARMEYRRFLAYNIVGGIAWVTSMILVGYYLIDMVDPILKPVFGPHFTVAKQIDKIAILVIAVSVGPIVWKAAKTYWASRKARAVAPITTPASTAPVTTVPVNPSNPVPHA